MITVFGSINIDLVTPVARLPGPGETVVGRGYDVVPGGKGANQALAAARAGAAVRMVGCVGRDAFADPALALLAAGGVDLSAVRRCPAPTGCAMIAVDERGENQIVVAAGANLEAVAAQVEEGWLDGDATVVLQMEVPHAENWTLVGRAAARGARVVLNLAPAGAVPAEALAGIDVLVANEGEAAALARNLGAGQGGVLKAARGIAAGAGAAVVVTLGRDGAVGFTPAGEGWTVGALAIEATDTTAAGDAFVGALAAALDRGAGLSAALHRAAVAGGLACTRAGAQPSLPTAAEVDARLGDLEPARPVTDP